jgi:hypothetical protein
MKDQSMFEALVFRSGPPGRAVWGRVVRVKAYLVLSLLQCFLHSMMHELFMSSPRCFAPTSSNICTTVLVLLVNIVET